MAKQNRNVKNQRNKFWKKNDSFQKGVSQQQTRRKTIKNKLVKAKAKPSQQWRLKNNNQGRRTPVLKKIEKNLAQVKASQAALKKAQNAYYGTETPNKNRNSRRSAVQARVGAHSTPQRNQRANTKPKVDLRNKLKQVEAVVSPQKKNPNRNRNINKAIVNKPVIIKNRVIQKRNPKPTASGRNYTILVANDLPNGLLNQRAVAASVPTRAPRKRVNELNPRIQREIAIMQSRSQQIALPTTYVDMSPPATRLQGITQAFAAAPIQPFALPSRQLQRFKKPLTLNERFSQL